MNKIKLAVVLWTIILSGCSAQQPSAKSSFEPVAVIELFTSEGCSSCPPADRLLTKYAQDSLYDGVRIFPIAFHVDYWDRLGWRDSFSSSAFSDRQQEYARALDLPGIYTPQMVVNGTRQFVGNDETALRDAIHYVGKQKSEVQFTQLQVYSDAAGVKLDYRLNGELKDREVHIAIVSPYVQTDVKRGENKGRKLSHTNVVRKLISLSSKGIRHGGLAHFHTRSAQFIYSGFRTRQI